LPNIYVFFEHYFYIYAFLYYFHHNRRNNSIKGVNSKQTAEKLKMGGKCENGKSLRVLVFSHFPHFDWESFYFYIFFSIFVQFFVQFFAQFFAKSLCFAVDFLKIYIQRDFLPPYCKIASNGLIGSVVEVGGLGFLKTRFAGCACACGLICFNCFFFIL